ncbi:hypothetical protein LCGC14_1723360 [marine sediment metagenome]|uniref:Uncharacterized protein n=1 Tax=marine sediment metagenome TaxID=412755 RepID=A0A0F9JS94_9ZZZZ
MKIISFILLGVALLLAVIGLVFYSKIDRDKRIIVLESLKKARDIKAAKKAETDFANDLENEVDEVENMKILNNGSDASKEEKPK